MEHEWFFQAILPEELSEFFGHGDTSLFSVFEGHRVGLTKMNNSAFYIEPEGSRFDDLIKAKARVKTAVKHEFQVFTGAFSNKPISNFGEQKSFLAAGAGVLILIAAAGFSRHVRSTSTHQRKNPRKVIKFP